MNWIEQWAKLEVITTYIGLILVAVIIGLFSIAMLIIGLSNLIEYIKERKRKKP